MLSDQFSIVNFLFPFSNILLKNQTFYFLVLLKTDLRINAANIILWSFLNYLARITGFQPCKATTLIVAHSSNCVCCRQSFMVVNS